MRYNEILTAAGFFAASASAAAIAISNAANIAFATPLTALNSRSASEPVVVIGQPAPLLLITCADPKFLGECETWPGAELKCCKRTPLPNRTLLQLPSLVYTDTKFVFQTTSLTISRTE